MDQARAQLLREYDTAIVSAFDPGHGWTDPALTALQDRRPAVVMTAWNPGFSRPSRTENVRANLRMRDELDRTGCEVWRADGRSPDGTVLEEGWIVWDLPMDVGLRIAAQFGQFAVYRYDESGERTTVACPASTATPGGTVSR